MAVRYLRSPAAHRRAGGAAPEAASSEPARATRRPDLGLRGGTGSHAARPSPESSSTIFMYDWNVT
jgi:hypothetical protein